MILLKQTIRFSTITKCTQLLRTFSTTHKVWQIKNNSMMIVEDKQKILPYMAQVQLQNDRKGIVMKIQQSGNAYIAMYEEISTQQLRNNQIKINKIHKSWKSSPIELSNKISNSLAENTGIYDVNQVLIQKPSSKNEYSTNFPIVNGSKRRIISSSPVLNACYDLYYGDMISFMGCRGSKKTQTAASISRQFSSNDSRNLTIYMSPYFKQAKQFSQQNNNLLAFTIPNNKKPTDIGVYMLTLKAITLSAELKQKGFDVLLIIDNLNDIMMRQWNLLQSIKFNPKVVSSTQIFQYNSLRISPISILNEIYSSCQDNHSLFVKAHKPVPSTVGSLTSILIAQKQNNELVQEITSYNNNLKHLQTLAQVVQFPLDFKINSNAYYQKPKTQQQQQKLQEQQGYYQIQLYRFWRSYINKLLRQKNQTELRRQLYNNDLRDAPWDYFFLLDGDWWTAGIKELGASSKSYHQTTLILKWLTYNIQHDLVGHWNLSAKQAFKKYISYLKLQRNLEQTTPNQKIQFQDEDLQLFIDDAKMQGLLNPFKKDYLS